MELYKRGSRGEVVKQIQKALAGAGLKVIPDGIYGEITVEAVKAFQTKKGIKPDGVVGTKTLALLIPARFKRSRRTITEIIIHCSATAEYKNFTAADIRRWHTEKPPRGRGWSDIGYHYVVQLDGTVEQGRDVDIVGAHCTGHNTHSIGVCYVGGYDRDGRTPKDTRTELQKNALLNLLLNLKSMYPQAAICGHHDFDASKPCPCFNARSEYRRL